MKLSTSFRVVKYVWRYMPGDRRDKTLCKSALCSPPTSDGCLQRHPIRSESHHPVFVRKSIMGSHHNLLSTVPFIVLLFRHRSNHHPVYPSRIVIRSLNLIPAGILQYLNRHSEQRLRTHPGCKLTFIAHITNRNVHYPISRISRHGAYFLSFQTNYRYYQQAIEKRIFFFIES